jgi:glycosyltransferase involved in cell wall biosynthesis
MRHGIHVLGVIDPEDKRDMLAAMDILALPSSTESFGIFYLEGWANLKPVIAADARAVRELVRDGENGLVVPFGASPRVAQAILDLLRDTSLARSLARAGYDLAMSTYTWPRVLERVKHAYSIAMGYPLT